MNNLIIIGAGGCGREVLQIVKEINKRKNTYNVKGFLDDNINSLNGLAGEYDVIGTIKEYIPEQNDVFSCAILNPETRKCVVEKMKKKGAVFVSLIEPRAGVSDFTTLGEGCILYAWAGISCNVRIGNFCIIEQAGIGHDVVIGDYSAVCQNTSIGGCTEIGERVMIGSNVCIIPGRKIGSRVEVGAGSVVIRNVGEDKKVFGNPAKVIDL